MEQQMLTQEAIASWQGIQDSLSGMTGLELGVYEPDGLIGRMSGVSPFCADVRAANGASCKQECEKIISEAFKAPVNELRYYRCWVGQKVFAVRLGMTQTGGPVLSGGKTFGSRADYDEALARLRGLGVRVQQTGRHKYRFTGKKRLDETIDQIKLAAGQYFAMSMSMASYRLRLNRQAALIENASLLYQVNDTASLLDGLMRALESLFGLERLSIHLYALTDGEAESRSLHGAKPEEIFADQPLFIETLRTEYLKNNGPIMMEDPKALARAGLRPEAGPAICMPVAVSGELVGHVCVYGARLGREDMEAFRAYTRQIATCIDNRRLRTGVLGKLNRLKAMSSLYTSAGVMSDPDDILRLLLEKSAEQMSAERCSLMLLDEKTDELIVRYSKGIDEDDLGSFKARYGEGIAGFVAQTGSPVVVRDAQTEERPGTSLRPEYKTGSFVSIPLKVRGRVVGVVNLTDKTGGGAFDYDDLEFLLGLASHAGSALERTVFEEKTGELEGLVINDELTGLWAWRHFNMRLAEELLRSKRYGRKLSLMVVDVDGFKDYRSLHGDRPADEALRRLAGLFRSSLRTSDIIARYSDSMFAVAFPETQTDRVVALAGRLRRRVEAVRFPDAEMNDGVRLGIGIGIAGYPDDAERPRALFDAALAALDRSKEQDRE